MNEGMEWVVGSNGNLFADAADHRYCIGISYWVTRDGVVIGKDLANRMVAEILAGEDADKEAAK